MNTEKIVHESRVIMLVALIIGIVLLATGIIFNVMEIHIISNNKAIIGLSFIPLSVAFIYYYKSSRIKKSPQKMRNIIINENDERLVTLKNEADANAFKIIQGALLLAYMGYTLMVPEDIFESVGWWILMILLFICFISQGVLLKKALDKEKSKDNEE